MPGDGRAAARPRGPSVAPTPGRQREGPAASDQGRQPGRPATPKQERRIRRARREDLPAIIALEAACFEPYRRASAASLRRSLASRRQSVWVVDGPTGLHALLVLWHLPKALRIYDVATHPDARGQGLGGVLLREAERQARAAGARRIILEAEEQDPRLVGWYEHHGFAVKARFKDYYHRGCSALRLEKDLDA